MSVYEGHGVTLHHADCLDVLRTLPDASVDSVVTDPPYGLEFMGKAWDSFTERADTQTQTDTWGAATTAIPGSAYASTLPRFTGKQGASLKPFQDWCEAWATECLRVLKPGGHLLAFGGTRTWHRLACAVEDAGFEVRDSIAWLYGSGFPKSLDVSKAIDKAQGATGTYGEPKSAAHAGWIDRGRMRGDEGEEGWQRPWMQDEGAVSNAARRYLPGSTEAQAFAGWGTALKPAFEPVVVARKPLVGTVAANVLTHGTGALNIGGCRVGDSGGGTSCSNRDASGKCLGHNNAGRSTSGETRHGPEGSAGRWPANVVLDESQAAALDEQSGESRDGTAVKRNRSEDGRAPYEASSYMITDRSREDQTYGGQGGASRFFYVAKADASERPRVNGTAHPTVKPLALMRWLVRLVTPPGGTVLEPFAGSGTTVEACIVEGFQCIAIEREADYLPLIRQRIDRRRDPVEALRGQAADLGLFDLLGGEGA